MGFVITGCKVYDLNLNPPTQASPTPNNQEYPSLRYMTFQTILLGVLVLVSIGIIWLKLGSKKHPPLPPGPPAEPLIGHLRIVPSRGQDTFFYELGKLYGDVIYLNILGRNIIVLNSVQAAVELLEKRSSNYSDRPGLPLYEIMGFEKSLVFMRYGKDFQMHRRMYQEHFGKNESMTYRPIQTREARVLVQNLVSKPELREEHLIRYSTAIIMRIAYGHQVTTDDDPYVKIAEDTCGSVGNTGPPGGTLVDILPFLRHLPSWFPGTHSATVARGLRPIITEMHEYPFTEVKKQMAEGTAKPSFLATRLEILNREGTETPNIIQHILGAAGTLYIAGADTTSASLSFFFLAMVLHPECQNQAYEEINATIGPGRLPEFNDRLSLPYLECIVQETLRWVPAVPKGVPHRSLADDIYNGMFIPKDSIIIANARAMTLDEGTYTNPLQFNPSRFLPRPKGLGEPYPNGPFGFGRRICPGRHLANDSLWVAMAAILATLSISKVDDDSGKETKLEPGSLRGIVNHPLPFQCNVQPRTAMARSLIAQMDTSDSY